MNIINIPQKIRFCGSCYAKSRN